MIVYAVVSVFIVFDIMTGVINALDKKELSSYCLRTGLYRKLSELLAVAICHLLQYGAEYIDIGIDLPIVNSVAGYICLMEFTSIIENLVKINPDLFSFFAPYLKGNEDNNGKNRH